MQFNKLVLENFKSFKGRHSLDLSGTSGLSFVTGNNLIDDNLGANGAGKSSLWDALYWCLYGKTLRSVKAGNIHTWNTTGKTTVALTVDDSLGTTHIITRAWNPNALKIDENLVDQETVTELVGLTPEEFEHSVIIGQFSTMFFDLAPAQKLALFTDVLQLGVWMDASDIANKKVKEIEHEIHDIEQVIHQFTGRYESAAINAKDAVDQIEEWKSKKKERLSDLHVLIIQTLSKLAQIKRDMKEDENFYAQDEHFLSTAKERKKKLGLQIRNYETKDIKLRHELKSHVKDRDSIDLELDDFRNLRGKCSVCRQEIEPRHAAKHMNVLLNKKKYVNKDIDALGAQSAQYIVQLEKLSVKDSKYDDYIDSYEHTIGMWHVAQTNYMAKMSALTIQYNACEASVIELQTQDAPQQKIYDSLLNQLVGAEEKIKELTEELNVFLSKQEAIKFWVKGFKDLRLHVVDQALTALEIEVNNNLVELGMVGWSIKFDIEKETKSNTINKGFHTFIHSPHNTDLVPWESWSGGEAQRLRLAGTMGLANLILNRKNVRTNLEVWDEPSAHLSPEGIDDLLRLLERRAQEIDKQVWLVDHRSLDFGGFRQVVTVSKDQDGSALSVVKISGE